MKRGEIYYIANRHTHGAEIAKGRPAVIVSADTINRNSEVVEVVYLTTSPRREMPTHVPIETSGTSATACCEQIDSISKQLVGDYYGTCTTEEMSEIDAALLYSLGIFDSGKVTEQKKPYELSREILRHREITREDRRLLDAMAAVKAERDRYAKMLDKLLEVEV